MPNAKKKHIREACLDSYQGLNKNDECFLKKNVCTELDEDNGDDLDNYVSNNNNDDDDDDLLV